MTKSIDRLIAEVRFAATYADRREATNELAKLVGKDKALDLIHNG